MARSNCKMRRYLRLHVIAVPAPAQEASTGAKRRWLSTCRACGAQYVRHEDGSNANRCGPCIASNVPRYGRKVNDDGKAKEPTAIRDVSNGT